MDLAMDGDVGVSFSEDELKNGLYAESLKFFGEYGSSFIQLKLMEYDGKKVDELNQRLAAQFGFADVYDVVM